MSGDHFEFYIYGRLVHGLKLENYVAGKAAFLGRCLIELNASMHGVRLYNNFAELRALCSTFKNSPA